MEKKLSVIIPVYNAEKYIFACLESLSLQDMKDDELEIICVNDGSKDNSANIIQKFADTCSYIRLIHKENRGVSSARNVGIREATGKFIVFCDADDIVRPHSFGEIITEIIRCDAKSANFGMLSFTDKAFIKWDQKLTMTKKGKGRYTTPNVWGWVFSASIIKDNNLFFREDMKYGEDTLFTYHYSNFVENDIRLEISNPVYGYRMNPSSVMHVQSQSAKLAHFEDMIKMALEYKELLHSSQLSGEGRTETQLRQYQSTQAALFYAMKADQRAYDTLQYLKNNDLYPYPMLWYMLKMAKGFKLKFLQLLQMFFNCEWYYCSVSWLYNIKNHIGGKK